MADLEAETSSTMQGRLACAPNFRDVAATVPGLRYGQLFRSDLVVDPAGAEVNAIESCGIRLVLDLRGRRELEDFPNRWFADRGIEIVHVDVNAHSDPTRLVAALDSASGVAAAHAMMTAAYREFPKGAVPALNVLGERIAGGDVPVLVHCAAGKDRTGFVVAALLLAIGISPRHVIADYLASSGRLHPRTLERAREAMMETLGRLDEESLAYITGTDAEFLSSALRATESEFGSLEAFIRKAGLDEARVEGLRSRLLA